MPPFERSTTDTLIRRLRALGCDVEKAWGGLFGVKGRPDLNVLIPASPWPIPLRIEMKQPGKKPTPLQEKRLRDLEARGVYVLRQPTVKEAVAFVETLMKLYPRVERTAVTLDSARSAS